MEDEYIADKTFEKLDFTRQSLTKAEYENCTFINCDFSNSDLTDRRFADCEFSGCNLSLAKLSKTAFRDIKFNDCKMLGEHFENCNEFGFTVSFRNCILNHSSFYKRNLKKTVFKNCKLIEVDFTESDLTGAVLDNCDLAGATFSSSILEKADLRTAINYSIDPEANKIKKARFSLSEVSGLLHKYDIEITVNA